MTMADLLADQGKLIERLPELASFRPPATTAAIDRLEAAMKRQLPPPYKEFLLAHEGGFVSSIDFDRSNEKSVRSARWNSNYLRGCEDLAAEYVEQALLAKDVEPELSDWPYVPFCHTSGQEVLVFGPPTASGQCPVLDAFHELPYREWACLAPSFEDFLRNYIEADGYQQMSN